MTQFQWSDEVLEEAARAIYDTIYGEGAWDNPGALPDEIDRDLYRRAASAAFDAGAAIFEAREQP